MKLLKELYDLRFNLQEIMDLTYDIQNAANDALDASLQEIVEQLHLIIEHTLDTSYELNNQIELIEDLIESLQKGGE